MINLLCPHCKTNALFIDEEIKNPISSKLNAYWIYCGECMWKGKFERTKVDMPFLYEKRE